MWLSLMSAVGLLVCVRFLDFLVLPKRQKQRLGRVFTLFAVTPPLIYFASLLMLTYRPVISALFTIATYAVIVVLNNAKVRAVREPLVYSDFHLFREVIHHPHLYVKYIDMRKLVGLLLFGVAAIYSSIVFEPPIIQRIALADYLPAFMFFGVLLGTIYAIVRGPLRNPFRKILISFGPKADVEENVSQLGLVVCLIFYFFLSGMDKIDATESENFQSNRGDNPDRKTIWSDQNALPNIVAVQAESFFDVRYLEAGIDRTILKNYDRLKDQATFFGRLSVPVWGAYTMRTEFAFLSGLPEEALGHHRFNPYLQLGNKPFWTIAHNMKALGYRTVCVHPFPSSFFNRKKVFPNLGFDDFIDMNAFSKDDRFGPYVGDVALGERIIELLDSADQPLFIFAITMENHGAWPEDRLKNESSENADSENWPLDCFSLNHYVTHMRNTDKMMGIITDYMKAQETSSVFCLYGDHMPNLQNAFSAAKYDDPRTDYLVWLNEGQRNKELNTTADTLGRLLLDAAFNERSDNLPDEKNRSDADQVQTT